MCLHLFVLSQHKTIYVDLSNLLVRKIKYLSKEKLDIWSQKDFERNQKRSAPSKKEQPNTTGKNRKNLNRLNQIHMAFGPITSCFSIERDFRFIFLQKDWQNWSHFIIFSICKEQPTLVHHMNKIRRVFPPRVFFSPISMDHCGGFLAQMMDNVTLNNNSSSFNFHECIKLKVVCLWGWSYGTTDGKPKQKSLRGNSG